MRKGVILVVVMGVMMIILIWAFAAMFFMTQESRIAGHKVRRARAILAAKAGIVRTMEDLREGVFPDPTQTYNSTWSIGNPADRGYPISVDITIHPKETDTTSPFAETRQVDATVNY